MKTFGIALIACFIGFFSGGFFYEADVMWFEEGFLFGFMGIMACYGLYHLRTLSLHELFLQDNPGVGLIRLALWGAVAWCVFTLTFFGDPSIEGIWYLYYLVLSVGAIITFGIGGAETFKVRLRVDVYERKNFGAAMFIAAFIFSTGLIWGGAMWGDLGPDALEYAGVFELLESYEEGTWITPWFFIMGWIILFLTMKLWFMREKNISGEILRRERRFQDGKAAALYCVACALPITDSVAGNYYGLYDSFVSFSVIAFPVLAGEMLRPPAGKLERDPNEGWFYLGTGVVAVLLSPVISTVLGFR